MCCRAGCSGCQSPVAVVVEAECEEALEVDGCGAVGEPGAVAGGAAVGDAAAGSHEPGEGAFDHWSPSPVVVGEVAVAPGSAGFDEFGVVGAEDKDSSVVSGGAVWTHAAAAALGAEGGLI